MKKYVIGLCLTLSLICGKQINAQENLTPITTICNEQTTELKISLSKLWMDHMFWSRNFIISDISSIPDKDEVTKRLLKNQDDLGDSLKPFYGEDVGNTLAELLREHIEIAGHVINSAKNKDSISLEINNKLWYENANQIAKFLSELNPTWDYSELKDLFQVHLDMLSDQVSFYLKEDWDAAIESQDKGEDHMLLFAKVIYDGIIKQFPEKFQ